MGIMHSCYFLPSLLQPKSRKVKIYASEDKRWNHISSENISLIHNKSQSLHEKGEDKQSSLTVYFFQAIK